MNTSLPSDPEIIKEYLEILRAIERERQVYNPLPVGKLLDAVQIETDRAHSILTRIVGSDSGIKLFSKDETTVDPLGLDPYEKMEQVEYVEVFDEVKFKAYLKQLSDLLNERPIPSPDLPASDDQQKIDWPDDFRWKDENHFDLAGKGELEFSPQENNKRRIYFKMMANAKGVWVNISEMSSATGEKPSQVRIKIDQIKLDKIKNKGLSKIIMIEPKKDSSGGAYRLVSYPKCNV